MEPVKTVVQCFLFEEINPDVIGYLCLGLKTSNRKPVKPHWMLKCEHLGGGSSRVGLGTGRLLV